MANRTSPVDEATLLAAASRLLAEQGPDGLTVRAIAEAAGCSTMAIYSRFGGKHGVVNALYVEGFDVLHQALDQLWEALGDEVDPLERLASMCRMYRRVALDHATHYAVMLGDAVPGFEPTHDSRQSGMRTFMWLVEAIAAAQAAGLLRDGDPVAEAHVVWGVCHGMVSLELQGLTADPDTMERRYACAFSTVIDGMRPG